MQLLLNFHFHVFISPQLLTAGVLLHSGPEMEVCWCQIRTIGRMGRNLTEPNVQEVHCDVSYMWSGIVMQLQYSS